MRHRASLRPLSQDASIGCRPYAAQMAGDGYENRGSSNRARSAAPPHLAIRKREVTRASAEKYARFRANLLESARLHPCCDLPYRKSTPLLSMTRNIAWRAFSTSASARRAFAAKRGPAQKLRAEDNSLAAASQLGIDPIVRDTAAGGSEREFPFWIPDRLFASPRRPLRAMTWCCATATPEAAIMGVVQ